MDDHVDAILDIPYKAFLKPFQSIRCVQELVIQRRLYTVANSLGVIQKVDRDHVRRVKKTLHLPGLSPNSIWLYMDRL